MSAEPDLVASTKNSRVYRVEDSPPSTRRAALPLLSASDEDDVVSDVLPSVSSSRDSNSNNGSILMEDVNALRFASNHSLPSSTPIASDEVSISLSDASKLYNRPPYNAIPFSSQSLPASSEPPRLLLPPMYLARKHKSHPVLLHIAVVDPTKGIDHIANVAQTINKRTGDYCNNLTEDNIQSSTETPRTAQVGFTSFPSSNMTNISSSCIPCSIINAVESSECGLVLDCVLLSRLQPSTSDTAAAAAMPPPPPPPPPVAPPRKRRKKPNHKEEVTLEVTQISSQYIFIMKFVLFFFRLWQP